MNESLLESYLVPCDELTAEDFKTSSVIIFQGDRLPSTFSLDCISNFLISIESPWIFIAKERLKNKFYIAIGFEDNSNTPFYVTNLLCTFIKNKVFIKNIYKCSKSSARLRKICLKHQKKVQSELEQSKDSEFLLQNQTQEDQHDTINSNENLNLKNNENVDIVSSLFIPDSPLPSESITLEKSSSSIWTENLPSFAWDTPIKEYSIGQTEIEKKLGLFNEVLLVENTSPLKSFQNTSRRRLMFAPHASQNFLDRIIKHESIFDANEDPDH
ncbi:hypothetical protein M9Y10_009530 [Tritrichomonas musculus]|uniref:Uncharacterized protein n=1 Tax=Tritrichomonas musculus TaxID=1915356 RepID=A0ABR2IQ45_9EUKA